MNKPIKMPLPKCVKCKKVLEPLFTTEKEEDDESKPEILIMFGKCKKCKIISVCNVIEIKDIPNEKDIELIKKELEKVKDGI